MGETELFNTHHGLAHVKAMAIAWVPQREDDSSFTRIVEGELRLSKDLVPSFEFPRLVIRVRLPPLLMMRVYLHMITSIT